MNFENDIKLFLLMEKELNSDKSGHFTKYKIDD